MKKLIGLGEALIDFIPQEKNKDLADIKSFSPKVGGAPLNCLGAYQKLGGKTIYYTMVGKDPFGDKIINYLLKYKMDIKGIKNTSKARTALAFVSYRNNDREFFFSNNNPSYNYFKEQYLNENDFKEAYAFHFCSVAIKSGTMLSAHKKALTYAKNHNLIISFDLNLRPQIYNDDLLLKERVKEFIPEANIIKIADDEFTFLFGDAPLIPTLTSLLNDNTKLILYTAGKDETIALTKKCVVRNTPPKTNPLDTTGAGDGFIGSFLYQLARDEVSDLASLSEERLLSYLKFSNTFASLSTTKKGAISSYPSLKEVLLRLS